MWNIKLNGIKNWKIGKNTMKEWWGDVMKRSIMSLLVIAITLIAVTAMIYSSEMTSITTYFLYGFKSDISSYYNSQFKRKTSSLLLKESNDNIVAKDKPDNMDLNIKENKTDINSNKNEVTINNTAVSNLNIFKMPKDEIQKNMTLSEKMKLLNLGGKISAVDYAKIKICLEEENSENAVTDIVFLLKKRLSSKDYESFKEIVQKYIELDKLEQVAIN